jgi:dihydropteroate synthase
MKAAVAREALRKGARIVNDVTALRGDRAMARTCADAGARVVLMHMQGTPRTMQAAPAYGDVVAEVRAFLASRAEFALRAGISRDNIFTDPGIGFGKTPEHNLDLLRRLDELVGDGRPVVVGTSRKSFIGRALGRGVGDRAFGTAATVAAAVLKGAGVVGVHDVREMSDVARMSARLR